MPASAPNAPETVWLLGHDIRWRLAKALSNSDHRVGELVVAVGERQNLVSYHLGLLRRAGVVWERRSSADARDVYYHLDLDGLRSDLNQAAIAGVCRTQEDTAPTRFGTVLLNHKMTRRDARLYATRKSAFLREQLGNSRSRSSRVVRCRFVFADEN